MPTINGRLDEISGAIIDVYIGVDWPRQEMLRKHGLSIPPALRVRAQIDTGSGVSAVDPSILSSLDLKPLGKRRVITPSTGHTPHECHEFVVSISLVELSAGQHHRSTAVIESIFLPEEGIQALLGRDLLENCTFFYNGRQKEFTFDY
jgi:hypothetical protein